MIIFQDTYDSNQAAMEQFLIAARQGGVSEHDKAKEMDSALVNINQKLGVAYGFLSVTALPLVTTKV